MGTRDPETSNNRSGTRVRELRRRLRMSQAVCAAEAGIAISTLHLAEKHGPTERVAVLLASALGCTASDLTT